MCRKRQVRSDHENMAEKGKLQGRKVNHSGRKTFATALLQSGKPVTEVAQLGGWKNIGSLNHYSVPSVKQQEEASHTISSVMIPESPENMYHDSSDIADGQIGKIVHQPCSIVPIVVSGSSVAQMTNLSSNQMQSHSKSEKQDNPLSLFCGAVISGGTININIVSSSNKKKKHVPAQYLVKMFHLKNNVTSSFLVSLKKFLLFKHCVKC
ncbi:unnamed protein product [Mytilus edulis]|uniref:Tyr recombinase domain-containing protein n=1 Tax=Mytilus edulis TaxID=6550 RepID=A0A8S3U4V2_MYTED|nr:unnamed protein product [Mytilus edulis]